MEMFPGISMNPDVRFGKPCIVGTRIDVATIVGLIAAGETVETVAAEYQLSLEQVRAALADYPYVEPEDITRSPGVRSTVAGLRVYVGDQVR